MFSNFTGKQTSIRALGADQGGISPCLKWPIEEKYWDLCNYVPPVKKTTPVVTCANGVDVPDVGLNSCWANNDYLDDNRIFAENQASCQSDGLVWVGSIDNPRDGYCDLSEEEKMKIDAEFAATSEMFPDDLSAISEEELVQQPNEDNACEGIHCIKLYKPCPEGYIDADPCCPNTGKCIPDPDYVATDTPVLPVGDTPSTQLDASVPTRGTSPNTGIVPPKHRGGAGGLVGAVDETMLRSNTATATTETPTTEEPKQGGLGILAIGLIALKVLAT
jgi:hypothetical protein